MSQPPGARVNVAPATTMGVDAATVAEAFPASVLSPTASSNEEMGVGWPDDTAESSYLAEARERVEPPVPAHANIEEKDDADPKSLPSLEELVERIPADVREVLDELFRAKFTKVRRIPRSALKE